MKNTLTLSEAFAQGYTHFWVGRLGTVEDEFPCYPLNRDELEYYTKRTTDKKFDESEIEFALYPDGAFGKQTILCTKAYSPSISADDLVEYIAEKNEDNDQVLPVVLSALCTGLKDEEEFKAGLAMINNAMATYQSFQDAGILVTLD